MDDNRNSYSSFDDETEINRKSETDHNSLSSSNKVESGNADRVHFADSVSSRNDESQRRNSDPKSSNDSSYNEETSSELAGIAQFDRNDARDSGDDTNSENIAGTTFGFSGLALSVLSLFIMPILLGAAGIILGVVARRRGANTLGAWAIGIGAVSIIVGIFIVPFF
jgi:hypothetical protein